MSNLLNPRLLLLLAECLAASALLPSLALAVCACFPRRAAMRHLVWLALFAALLALPLAAAFVPSRFLIAEPAAPVMAAPLTAREMKNFAASPLPQAAPLVASTPMAAPARAFDPLSLLPFGLMFGLVLWLAGILFLLSHRALALLGLRRLRRASVVHDLPEIETGCELRLATGADVQGPMTWGMFRPVILLPQQALAWPREKLDLVLRHELAHVARHDMLTQTLALLACAFYWPNPLVWLAARRLRREAEIAADDAVLAAGVRPSAYAEALLALAAEFRGAHLPGVGPALAMAAPSALAARMTSILSPSPSRTGVTRMDAFKTLCLSGCALALITLARPDLAAAQVEVAPVAPPAAPAIAPVPVSPEVRVEAVPADAASVAQARARIQAQAAKMQAQADAIKARGDVLAAKALQKAKSEKDPAKRAKDMADAATVRAKANAVKVQAVTIRAQANRDIARAVTLNVRPNADGEIHVRVAANDTPSSKAEAQSSAEGTGSSNSALTFRRGAPQNSDSNSNNNLTTTRPEGTDMTERYVTGNRDVQIDVQVNRALEEAMNRPELRDVIREAVRTATNEARSKISATIAEARAKAGLPPTPPRN